MHLCVSGHANTLLLVIWQVIVHIDDSRLPILYSASLPSTPYLNPGCMGSMYWEWDLVDELISGPDLLVFL